MHFRLFLLMSPNIFLTQVVLLGNKRNSKFLTSSMWLQPFQGKQSMKKKDFAWLMIFKKLMYVGWFLRQNLVKKTENIICTWTLVKWISSRIIQKQPTIGVLRKRCSANMQQIYRRIPMPKCDFNNVALQLYWNHNSAWVFSCKFAAYFCKTLSTYGWLLLIIIFQKI